MILYDVDTMPGQSGMPIWLIDKPTLEKIPEYKAH